jgi:Short C-terminal domain
MADGVFLLIGLAFMFGAYRVVRRLTAWRIDTLQKLARLRNSGSLSDEEFEAAQARVRRD